MTAPSAELLAWLDELDELPRTPRGVLAYGRGETRVRLVSDALSPGGLMRRRAP